MVRYGIRSREHILSAGAINKKPIILVLFSLGPLGWYQPVWFPYVMEIRKEGEKYLCVMKESDESGVWKAQGEPIELTQLPNRLGFTGFDRHLRNILTYNKTLKRFELTNAMTGKVKTPG